MMRAWLDENIDHKLLIPKGAKGLRFEQSEQDDAYHLPTSLGNFSGGGPSEAHCAIDAERITPETTATWCIEQLREHFPDTVSTLRLSFDIEPIAGPYYHYTHGLRKHDGNSQRIAHGHRSKIEIWKDGDLDQSLMRERADEWKDIYIGTRSDLDQANCTDDNYAFRYRAQQGEFFISLPKTQCYLIDSYSTVEYIAAHLADTLKQGAPASDFHVRAFEGFGKGAIAER